jgi:hypothetical protein
MSRLLAPILFFLLFSFSAFGQNKVDALIHKPFGYACDLEMVQSKLRGKVKEKKPVENPHADGVVDTVTLYGKGKNELAIYEGKYNTFCYGLELHSKKWQLESDLQIGMDRAEFLKAFPKAIKESEIRYKLFDSDRVDWAIIEFNRRERVSAVFLGFYID